MAATAVPLNAIPSIDPATGETLGYVNATSVVSLPDVLTRAQKAQVSWAEVPVAKRCSLLKTLCKTIMASRAELADAVGRESGKPRVEALFADIFVSADSASYFAENAARILRTKRVPHHSTAAQAKSGYLSYESLGVVGMISSWNYPLALPMSQIIPPIVAGNAVICKTSEFTPQCGSLIGTLFTNAGFPKDLLTIVQGTGEVGQALIDACPDKVIFTGSVATGRRVAEACARQLI